MDKVWLLPQICETKYNNFNLAPVRGHVLPSFQPDLNFIDTVFATYSAYWKLSCMYWFGVPWRLAYQRHEHSPVNRIPTAIDLAMNMRAHLVQLRTNIHQAFPSDYLWAPLPPSSAKHHLLTINAWSAKYHLLRFRKVCLCHSFTGMAQSFATVFQKCKKWDLAEILQYAWKFLMFSWFSEILPYVRKFS